MRSADAGPRGCCEGTAQATTIARSGIAALQSRGALGVHARSSVRGSYLRLWRRARWTAVDRDGAGARRHPEALAKDAWCVAARAVGAAVRAHRGGRSGRARTQDRAPRPETVEH